MGLETKFRVAMAAFAAIGVAEWFTLSGRIRVVALIVIAWFAFRSWIHYSRERLETQADRSGK